MNDGIVFYDNSGDLSYSCVGKLFVYPMAVVNKYREKRWSAGFIPSLVCPGYIFGPDDRGSVANSLIVRGQF